jgi:hypothetical protein
VTCSGGFGALAGNAALPSATRPTDVPRVDVGQVDVWHVDVRDVYHVWHVDVRDVKVHVAGHARGVQIIEGCSQDTCARCPETSQLSRLGESNSRPIHYE